MNFLWKIGGEAGFGIVTTGSLFSKIAAKSGYYIFDFIQYPSLIRGGHNSFEALVSDEEVSNIKETIDFLVCLNKETLDLHKKRLTSSTYVIYDKNEFQVEGDYIKIMVPFSEILKRLNGQSIMKNTIALGASLAILGGELEILNKMLEKQFSDKPKETIQYNQKFAETGFNYIKTNYKDKIKQYLVRKEAQDKLVLTANDAFSLASIYADCKFYSAYPMTPASSVLSILASWQEKTGIVVRHAEDEIAAVNNVIGASFMGVRSSTGTSGGGFALMVESISYAGVSEIPLVIFLSQRPGPATGMPTWTEQGDLLFTVNAGHGEFPKIVLAPGDQEEMTELTIKAYNLADIYQTPIIVMSDMFLSESHKSIELEKIKKILIDNKIQRGKTIDNFSEEKYLRYKLTDDGISPRLIPGKSDIYYQANSYEHLEDGHSTEDNGMRKKQVDKRNKKIITYLNNEFKGPNIYGDLENADVVLVGWGSTKGPMIEAMKQIVSKKKIAVIHFSHVYPLNKEKVITNFKEGKRYILVENNSQGQFGKLLLQETGVEIKEKLLKYDGRMFYTEEIINYLL